jgi:hypothetical protein
MPLPFLSPISPEDWEPLEIFRPWTVISKRCSHQPCQPTHKRTAWGSGGPPLKQPFQEWLACRA